MSSGDKNVGGRYRIRSYSRVHLRSWVICLDRDGYVNCPFTNCGFVAIDIEDMAEHFSFCNGTITECIKECKHCKKVIDGEKKLSLHITYVHPLEDKSNEIREVDAGVVCGKPRVINRAITQSWEFFLEIKGFIKCLTPGCFFLFETIDEIKKHYTTSCPMVVDSSKRVYVCDECQGKTLSKLKLKQHKRKSHSASDKLARNNKTITRAMLLAWCKRLREHHIAKCATYNCKYLDTNLDSLKSHYSTCREPKADSFSTCKRCGAWLTNLTSVGSHMDAHHARQSDADVDHLQEYTTYQPLEDDDEEDEDVNEDETSPSDPAPSAINKKKQPRIFDSEDLPVETLSDRTTRMDTTGLSVIVNPVDNLLLRRMAKNRQYCPSKKEKKIPVISKFVKPKRVRGIDCSKNVDISNIQIIDHELTDDSPVLPEEQTTQETQEDNTDPCDESVEEEGDIETPTSEVEATTPRTTAERPPSPVNKFNCQEVMKRVNSDMDKLITLVWPKTTVRNPLRTHRHLTRFAKFMLAKKSFNRDRFIAVRKSKSRVPKPHKEVEGTLPIETVVPDKQTEPEPQSTLEEQDPLTVEPPTPTSQTPTPNETQQTKTFSLSFYDDNAELNTRVDTAGNIPVDGDEVHDRGEEGEEEECFVLQPQDENDISDGAQPDGSFYIENTLKGQRQRFFIVAQTDEYYVLSAASPDNRQEDEQHQEMAPRESSPLLQHEEEDFRGFEPDEITNNNSRKRSAVHCENRDDTKKTKLEPQQDNSDQLYHENDDNFQLELNLESDENTDNTDMIKVKRKAEEVYSIDLIPPTGDENNLHLELDLEPVDTKESVQTENVTEGTDPSKPVIPEVKRVEEVSSVEMIPPTHEDDLHLELPIELVESKKENIVKNTDTTNHTFSEVSEDNSHLDLSEESIEESKMSLDDQNIVRGTELFSDVDCSVKEQVDKVDEEDKMRPEQVEGSLLQESEMPSDSENSDNIQEVIDQPEIPPAVHEEENFQPEPPQVPEIPVQHVNVAEDTNQVNPVFPKNVVLCFVQPPTVEQPSPGPALKPKKTPRKSSLQLRNDSEISDWTEPVEDIKMSVKNVKNVDRSSPEDGGSDISSENLNNPRRATRRSNVDPEIPASSSKKPRGRRPKSTGNTKTVGSNEKENPDDEDTAKKIDVDTKENDLEGTRRPVRGRRSKNAEFGGGNDKKKNDEQENKVEEETNDTSEVTKNAYRSTVKRQRGRPKGPGNIKADDEDTNTKMDVDTGEKKQSMKNQEKVEVTEEKKHTRGRRSKKADPEPKDNAGDGGKEHRRSGRVARKVSLNPESEDNRPAERRSRHASHDSEEERDKMKKEEGNSKDKHTEDKDEEQAEKRSTTSRRSRVFKKEESASTQTIKLTEEENQQDEEEGPSSSAQEPQEEETSLRENNRKREKRIDNRIMPSTKLNKPNQKVKCAVCNEEMTAADYKTKHMKSHNFMCWLQEEEPLPLEDTDYMLWVLNRRKKLSPKFVFKCELCQTIKKSVWGFVAHIQICGKSKEDMEKLLVTCDLCGKRMMPLSMDSHMVTHRQKSPSTPADTRILPGGPRSSATKCRQKLLEVMSGDEVDDDPSETVRDEAKEMLRCNECSYASTHFRDVRMHYMQKHARDLYPGSKEEVSCFMSLLKVVENRSIIFRIDDTIKAINDLRNKHFSKVSLFPELGVKWSTLPRDEFDEYLPYTKKSMKINIGEVDSNWTEMDIFECIADEDWQVIYCGGPVRAMSWCPTEGRQFIAIATHNTMYAEHTLSTLTNYSSSIQIWSLGLLNNTKWKTGDSREKAELVYGVGHRHGGVWAVEWCPSGGGTSSLSPSHLDPQSSQELHSTQQRLGLLAMACTDGTVPILSLPHPDSLDISEQPLILKADAVLILDQFGKEKAQCTSISWSKVKPHSTIVGGFVNGLIAAWDLESVSPLLRKGDILYPYKIFQAHFSNITSLEMIMGSDTFVLSGSMDRSMKCWDLRDTGAPLGVQRRGIVTSVGWLANSCSAVTGYDHAYIPTSSTLTMSPFKSFTALPLTLISMISSAVTSISTNDWINSVAASYENGQVIIIYGPTEERKKIPKFVVESTLYDFETGLTNIESKKTKNKSNNSKKKKNSAKKKGGDGEGDDEEDPASKHFLESDSYEDAIEKYGLLIKLDTNLTGPDELKNTVEEKLDVYPLAAINKVAWNPNPGSYLNAAIGYQSGFVLFTKVDSPPSYYHTVRSYIKGYWKD